MEERLRVMIVDDHPVFRQGLRDILETESDFDVVGEASDGQEALQLSRDLGPDVILMDINLPTINGLQVTRQIKGEQAGIKIIMLTGYDNEEQVLHAIRAGASAYCPKDILPEDLIHTIETAVEGLLRGGRRALDRRRDEELAGGRIGRAGRSIRAKRGRDVHAAFPLAKWKS